MADALNRMAADESLHTTDGNSTNIADLMQSGLASIAMAIGALPALDAANITYDNSTSGLAATYVGTAIDELASEKADSATTLAGYGITDAYTQTETDNLLSAKQDTLTAGTGIDITSNTISVDATAEEITFDDTNAGLGVSNTQDAIDALNDGLVQNYADSGVMGAKNLIPMALSDIKAANTSGTWSNNVYTYNGLDFTVNTDSNGNVTSIVVDGTASDITVFFATKLGKYLTSDTNYAINGCIGGTPTTYKLDITTSTEVIIAISTDGDGDVTPFTVDNSVSYRIRIVAYSGTVMSNVTFYPMIRLASDSDSTFQPYAKTNLQLTNDVASLNTDLTDIGSSTLLGIFNSTGTGQSLSSNYTGYRFILVISSYYAGPFPNYGQWFAPTRFAVHTSEYMQYKTIGGTAIFRLNNNSLIDILDLGGANYMVVYGIN